MAIFQLKEKIWGLKSGLFSLKVGGILIFQSGNTVVMSVIVLVSLWVVEVKKVNSDGRTLEPLKMPMSFRSFRKP